LKLTDEDKTTRQTKDHSMGAIPSLSGAMALNAATDKSMEFEFLQVGQSSATVTVTVLPFLVLVIFTCFPQSADLAPELP